MNEIWPWVTLALLGAYHGLNPAMGWLFAVALGLQAQRRAAVLQALVPIALGHAAAVVLAILVVGLAQVLVPAEYLRLAGASVLIGFGVYKLVKRAHPRWVGMRLGFRDLTLWSLLMSTAHGAGLMLVPALFQFQDSGHDLLGICQLGVTVAHAEQHAVAAPVVVSPAVLWLDNGITAVGIHTLAMLLVMAAVAVLIFEKVGLAILRRAWVNLDLVWAGALVGAGIITLFV